MSNTEHQIIFQDLDADTTVLRDDADEVVIVSDKRQQSDGFVWLDTPKLSPDGDTVQFCHPELWPALAKRRVLEILRSDAELKRASAKITNDKASPSACFIRLQLCDLLQVVGDIWDGVPSHGPAYWQADLPARPQDYTPEDWTRSNPPIWKLVAHLVTFIESEGAAERAHYVEQFAARVCHQLLYTSEPGKGTRWSNYTTVWHEHKEPHVRVVRQQFMHNGVQVALRWHVQRCREISIYGTRSAQEWYTVSVQPSLDEAMRDYRKARIDVGAFTEQEETNHEKA